MVWFRWSIKGCMYVCIIELIAQRFLIGCRVWDGPWCFVWISELPHLFFFFWVDEIAHLGRGWPFCCSERGEFFFFFKKEKKLMSLIVIMIVIVIVIYGKGRFAFSCDPERACVEAELIAIASPECHVALYWQEMGARHSHSHRHCHVAPPLNT